MPPAFTARVIGIMWFIGLIFLLLFPRANTMGMNIASTVTFVMNVESRKATTNEKAIKALSLPFETFKMTSPIFPATPVSSIAIPTIKTPMSMMTVVLANEPNASANEPIPSKTITEQPRIAEVAIGSLSQIKSKMQRPNTTREAAAEFALMNSRMFI